MGKWCKPMFASVVMGLQVTIDRTLVRPMVAMADPTDIGAQPVSFGITIKAIRS